MRGGARGVGALAVGDRGAALLSVLLFLLLIMIATVGVMAVVQSDLAAGIRQQQAVQVFNVAEAGVHYAIARLQSGNADRYSGEATAIPITDGSTTIGTASVQVRCLNGDLPSTDACSGAEPAYRRIISTGSLTVAGPTRVVTAVVEGTTSVTTTYAICAYESLSLDRQVTIYGAVGSEGNIELRGRNNSNRAAVCDSTPGGLGGRCGTPSPVPPTPFTAGASAVGTITCDGGGCANQVEGLVMPNQPAESVCGLRMTLTPPSPAGTDSLTVAAGQTVTLDPSVNYGDVTLAPSGTSVCPADIAQRATLIIDSGSDPNGTVTVRMRRLLVGKCARLVISGSGSVVLWLLEPLVANDPSMARQALKAEQMSVFGSTSTGTTPVAIAGDRFTINILSNKPNGDAGDCLAAGDATCGALHFDQTGLISGTFVVPGGGFKLDRAQITNGAILANTVYFDQGTTFTWDPRSRFGAQVYGEFRTLRSWKDQ
jgi:Tfp pilus assembly protein PilX